MFDALPLTEIITAAAVTIVVLVLAVLDARVREHHLLGLLVGCMMAIVWLGALPLVFAAGAVLVAAAAVAPDRAGPQASALAGVAVVLFVGLRDLEWALVTTAVMGAAASVPAARWMWRRRGSQVTILLIAGTTLGIYVNVPDTEIIAVLATMLGLLVVAQVVYLPLRNEPVNWAVVALLMALIVVAGAVGARGRPAAFAGALGAFGVVMVEPLAARIRPTTRAPTPVLVVVHAIAVLVASRVAGLRTAGVEAMAISAATLGAALVVLLALRQRSTA